MTDVQTLVFCQELEEVSQAGVRLARVHTLMVPTDQVQWLHSHQQLSRAQYFPVIFFSRHRACVSGFGSRTWSQRHNMLDNCPFVMAFNDNIWFSQQILFSCVHKVPVLMIIFLIQRLVPMGGYVWDWCNQAYIRDMITSIRCLLLTCVFLAFVTS